MQCATFSWVTIELSYVISINFVYESISNRSSIHPTRLIKTTNLIETDTNRSNLAQDRGEPSEIEHSEADNTSEKSQELPAVEAGSFLITFLLCNCVFGTKGGGIVMHCVCSIIVCYCTAHVCDSCHRGLYVYKVYASL